MDQKNIRRRIERGINWLDNNYDGPTAWWWAIDLDVFDFSLGTKCVLGQLFYDPDRPTWQGALRRSNLTEEQATDMGFSGLSVGYDYLYEVAWRKVIEELRGNPTYNPDRPQPAPSELFTLTMDGHLVGHLTPDALVRVLATASDGDAVQVRVSPF